MCQSSSEIVVTSNCGHEKIEEEKKKNKNLCQHTREYRNNRMSKTVYLVFGCALMMLLVLASDVNGRRIDEDDDLVFAASEKHKKYAKGDDSEHHESDHEEKGEKGKKGYESEHGYVDTHRLNAFLFFFSMDW